MTRDETVALWQQCESARKAALAESKSKEKAHEAAQVDLERLGGANARSAPHLGSIWPVYRREEREVRGFCSRTKPMSFDPATLEWMQAATVNFSGFIFEERRTSAGIIFPGQALFGDSARYTRTRPDETQPPSLLAPVSAKRFSTWTQFSPGRSLTSRPDSGTPSSAASRVLMNASSTARLGFSGRDFSTMSGSANANLAASRTSRRRGSMALPRSAAARSDGAFTLGEARFREVAGPRSDELP